MSVFFINFLIFRDLKVYYEQTPTELYYVVQHYLKINEISQQNNQKLNDFIYQLCLTKISTYKHTIEEYFHFTQNRLPKTQWAAQLCYGELQIIHDLKSSVINKQYIYNYNFPRIFT